MDIRELFNTTGIINSATKSSWLRVCFSLVILSLTVVSMLPNESTEPISIKPLSQDPVTVFPDFTKIADVDDKKRQFLDYLEGFIITENKEIAAIRSRLSFLK